MASYTARNYEGHAESL